MRETRRSLSSGFVRPLLIVMALAPAVSMLSAALVGLETLTRVLAYGGWVVIIFVPIAWRVWHLRRRKRRRVRATYP